jgi:hypothetical protein
LLDIPDLDNFQIRDGYHLVVRDVGDDVHDGLVDSIARTTSHGEIGSEKVLFSELFKHGWFRRNGVANDIGCRILF